THRRPGHGHHPTLHTSVSEILLLKEDDDMIWAVEGVDDRSAGSLTFSLLKSIQQSMNMVKGGRFHRGPVIGAEVTAGHQRSCKRSPNGNVHGSPPPKRPPDRGIDVCGM